MSKAVDTSRHSTPNRSVSSNRRVVVPDRMIVRHTNGISPIINMQTSTQPNPVVKKEKSVVRHQPIDSSKVHTVTQIKHQKQAVRPVKRPVEVSVHEEMNSMLERRNALPKHLARTAGRAHLLSQIVQPEPVKLRWHQRLFAGLTSQ